MAVGAGWGAGLIHGGLIVVVLFLMVSDPVLGIINLLLVTASIPLSLAVWGVGLVLATPGWFLLHRLGVRSRFVAAVYGATLAFAAVLGVLTGGFDLIPPEPGSSYSASAYGIPTVIDDRLTPYGWFDAARTSSVIALVAAIVGWVVAHVAYSPPKEPAA
ncbi:hypothetical protein CSW64_02710 [Caulobacter mirabilis]|uniref:Uncharacterized protein n=2 Tax=Caulobacter mirabilis TaxID=69666 RepID=A0A2D2ATR5_9CAUL|nr:hypothetical protein CSW64_02710 [Caulobacter mirabilis]